MKILNYKTIKIMKKNKNKAYLKPTTEIVYLTECTNILAGSGEVNTITPSIDGQGSETDPMAKPSSSDTWYEE